MIAPTGMFASKSERLVMNENTVCRITGFRDVSSVVSQVNFRVSNLKISPNPDFNSEPNEFFSLFLLA